MKLLNPSEISKAIMPYGPVHETTFEHNGRYAVFSTHQNPYEERLSIPLLDGNGDELERADLSSEYAAGLFDVKYFGEIRVEFTCWSEDLLCLTYHDRSRRVLFQPPGVYYGKRLAAHLITVEGPPL